MTTSTTAVGRRRSWWHGGRGPVLRTTTTGPVRVGDLGDLADAELAGLGWQHAHAYRRLWAASCTRQLRW